MKRVSVFAAMGVLGCLALVPAASSQAATSAPSAASATSATSATSETGDVWLATEYIPPAAEWDGYDNWGTYVFAVSGH